MEEEGRRTGGLLTRAFPGKGEIMPEEPKEPEEEGIQTQQELVNALVEMLREEGIEAPWTGIFCTCALMFEAAVILARRMLEELGYAEEAISISDLAIVARCLMDRIQLVAPVETMSSPVMRPQGPMIDPRLLRPPPGA